MLAGILDNFQVQVACGVSVGRDCCERDVEYVCLCVCVDDESFLTRRESQLHNGGAALLQYYYDILCGVCDINQIICIH